MITLYILLYFLVAGGVLFVATFFDILDVETRFIMSLFWIIAVPVLTILVVAFVAGNWTIEAAERARENFRRDR